MSIAEITPVQFDALAALERRVLAADGVRLKLEWASIREGRTVAALVWHERDELVAFIGLYAFGGPPDVELIGMVDPSWRRRGIATALLDRALEICAAHGHRHRLLIVPRGSPAAAALVSARGATLEHSEHSLALEDEPRRPPEDPLTTIRDATEADRADRRRILTAGFGPPPESSLDRLGGDGFRCMMIDHAGVPVGTAHLSVEPEHGYIGGFAIDPEHRGRGIGRDALGRFCVALRACGPGRVELQVEAQNDLALGLYTSTGFTPLSTEDYYRLDDSA